MFALSELLCDRPVRTGAMLGSELSQKVPTDKGLKEGLPPASDGADVRAL